MTHITVHFVAALLCLEAANAKPVEDSSEVTVSEQIDPSVFSPQGIYANGFGRPSVYVPQIPVQIGGQRVQQGNPHFEALNQINHCIRLLGLAEPPKCQTMTALNFEFRCQCNAKLENKKTSTESSSVPPDANAQAQQQIQQLQEQLRQQAEQIRKQQQLTNAGTGFQQFANLLSIADGLDCACTGVSPSGALNQQPPLPQPQIIGNSVYGYPSISGTVGGVPLTAPFNTRLLPLARAPLGPLLP